LIMKWILFSVALIVTVAPASPAADKETRVFELRTYIAEPGKLDALNARFRDHTCKLFEKHGMTNVGYWMPIDNPDRKLVYILGHESREAADKSWKAFLADPDWQKAFKESEKDGKLTDVATIQRMYLTATDYSPAIKPSATGDRVFELRTYTASKGNLDNL